MNDASRREPTIEVVQMLRGIAALLVVLYHARFAINGTAYARLGDRLFRSGACGVDLFFMISGFIMVQVTATSSCTRREVGSFFIKRWARIWPPYAIATIVMVLVDREQSIYDSGTQLGVLKAFAFYPNTTDGSPFLGWAPLVVGWTLCYEAWFYLLFGASMTFRRYRWVALAGMFIGCLVVIPLAFGKPVTLDAYVSPRLSPAILDIASNPMVWEFGLGAVFAAIYRSRFRLRHVYPLKVFVAVSATIFAWQFFAGGGKHGLLRWGIPSALLLLSLVLAHKQMTLRIPRWLVWLGDVSFSLYLVHRIVEMGLFEWLPETQLAKWGEGGAFFLASVAFSLIVASISHRYLERRLSGWLRRRLEAWLLAPDESELLAAPLNEARS